MTFLFIKRDSVFAGLNFTSQVFVHCVILSRSEFKVSAAVSGFSTTRKRLVSSANSLMFEPISFTISFIYRRNSSGPRMDPCGTPA